MSGFDDDEYESFDLDGAKETASAAVATDVEHDDDEDEDEDDLEDATDEEIDFVIAVYREDGQLYVQALTADLANDLEELIVQLRRLPGDAGAIGFVSLVEEICVIVRVRGPHVQVLLSDGGAATDWPIARDVADYLNEEITDDEDDTDPMGDIAILADLGLSDFEMGAIMDNLDLSSDQMLIEVAEKIKINPPFRLAVEAVFGS